MNLLEKWRDDGLVALQGTERLRIEILEKEAPHVEASKKLGTIENVSEPMVWGVSNWDRCYFQSERSPDFRDLASILFPNIKKFDQLQISDVNDVMHLLSHVHSGKDAFITLNVKHFVNEGRRELLKSRFAINVLTDTEAVDWLIQEHALPT